MAFSFSSIDPTTQIILCKFVYLIFEKVKIKYKVRVIYEKKYASKLIGKES